MLSIQVGKTLSLKDKNEILLTHISYAHSILHYEIIFLLHLKKNTGYTSRMSKFSLCSTKSTDSIRILIDPGSRARLNNKTGFQAKKLFFLQAELYLSDSGNLSKQFVRIVLFLQILC
jgi:hypothetical protein